MPNILHLANINFESELLQEPANENPIQLQLQLLPLLYGNTDDGLAVSSLPLDKQGKFHLLSRPGDLPYDKLETWGYSKWAEAWAQKHGISYEMPPWEVVKEVNSKEFSWKESPPLTRSELLKTEREVEEWIRTVEGPKVLKSCFGVAGRGHLLLPAPEGRTKKFLTAEFSRGLPVIGEPWVERDLDFSTQWYIHRDARVEYLGPTILVVNAGGQYRETRVGNVDIPLLEEHKNIAQTVLEKIARKGFFGHIGIDAMIYGGGNLHPIVEINARKTMGWVALDLQKRRFPKQTISLRYSADMNCESLLPQGVTKTDGSIVQFTRKLSLNTLDN